MLLFIFNISKVFIVENETFIADSNYYLICHFTPRSLSRNAQVPISDNQRVKFVTSIASIDRLFIHDDEAPATASGFKQSTSAVDGNVENEINGSTRPNKSELVLVTAS